MNATAQIPIDPGHRSYQGIVDPAKEGASIQAKHFMKTEVITVGPEARIREVARLFRENDIGAVPVVDQSRTMLGIISKGDLANQKELGIESLTGKVGTSHGMCAQDVMTHDVISVFEDAPLADVVETQQDMHIKYLPVLRKRKLVGIVSREDVVKVLSARPQASTAPTNSDDDVIRLNVIDTLMDILGNGILQISVVVSNGVVQLHGTVLDDSKLDPSRLAVAAIPHVVQVEDHRVVLQPY
jgi:CBS domain-containing protein